MVKKLSNIWLLAIFLSPIFGGLIGTFSFIYLHPVAAQSAPPVHLDVCLKITGTKAQARAAIRVLGLDMEMLRPALDFQGRIIQGQFKIVGFNHDVAIDLWERPILQFAVRDGQGNEVTPPVLSNRPILRIRFVSKQVRRKAAERFFGGDALPAGLEKVPCPTTRIWAGDQ